MMNGCPRWSFLTVPLLAALGCSDPVPRPAQGNVTVSIQKPTSGALNCPVPGKTYAVGNPKGPSPTNYGDRLIDGEHGATIKCSVTGSGPFSFSGTIKGSTAQSDQVTVTLTNGVINADKLTGTATVAVYTNDLAGSFVSMAGACTVNVVPPNVKPGSIWATLECPLVSNLTTGQGCSVGPVGATITAFVLENCEGS